jgi:hypothetical protein
MKTKVSFILTDPRVTAAAFSTRDIILRLSDVQFWRWRKALLSLVSVMKSFGFALLNIRP